MSNRRFPIVYLAIFFGTSLSIGSPASADNVSNSRQKLFEMDKVTALAEFSGAQKQACIKAFNTRYQSQYTLSGALAFNEFFSVGDYDQVFWKGEGNLHRGLVFTGAVTDPSGAKAGILLCSYAMTDYHLDFERAYVVPFQMKESKENGNIQASLSGGE